MPSVTAIICTYNRCVSLATTLKSIAASQLPEAVGWEILVVDNNSTDRTRDVVEDLCRRFPGRIRYHFEPRQGLSHARNAGIATARSEVLAFTDDDVIVQPMWLQNLTMTLHGGEWAGAAGRILPAQNFTHPTWLPDNLSDWGGIFCAYFDLSETACQLGRAPYGANMAFRKETFAKYGGFRTDLGRSADNKIGNEDCEFGRRLLEAGERLRYEPSAVVYHPVSEQRMTREYFSSWWFDYGRAMIRERGQRPASWGIPHDYLSFLRLATRIPLLALRWGIATNPQTRFRNRCRVWHAAGLIFEVYRRLSRGQTAAGQLSGLESANNKGSGLIRPT